MEYYWTLLNKSSNGVSRHCSSSHAREDFDWSSYPLHAAAGSSASALHSLMLHQQEKKAAAIDVGHSSSLYAGKGPEPFIPDPYLTCLKLGKRNYFDERHVAEGSGPSSSSMISTTKKGKPRITEISGASSEAAVAAVHAVAPRCQVEGCEVLLVKAKDYHRRHKVCEMHAKAPKVILLGIEQRFCQQCSRFHSVAEFDESKRSCRRRLAGHNQRRRKSSQEINSLNSTKPSQGRHPYLPEGSGSECALSLLSSTLTNNPTAGGWNNNMNFSAYNFPARCSTALLELIAENRASVLASGSSRRQLSSGNGQYAMDLDQMENNNNNFKHDPSRIRAGGFNPHGISGGHLTQANPNSAFRFFSFDDYYV